MVQEQTPQQQRVMDYVSRHTRFHFDDLFKDWGVALLKNNVEENERWGYKTASLQAMRARTNIHAQEISILGAPSSPLSHTFHYFDLIDEVQLKLGNRHLVQQGMCNGLIAPVLNPHSILSIGPLRQVTVRMVHGMSFFPTHQKQI
jgi:hypothetical protein